MLRLVDESTGTWGHICVDHIVMGDAPVMQPDPADVTLWADHGRDFYAPITFANVPDGRALWLGWMSNWDYARVLPTQPWRGQQSMVREIGLVDTPAGLRLRQQPCREMATLIDEEPLLSLENVDTAAVKAALAATPITGRQLRIRLAFAVTGSAEAVGIECFKGHGQAVRVGFDPAAGRFFIDRRTPTPTFAGQSERHDAKRLLESPVVEIELWIDGCTLELFADDGTIVISDLAFPDPAATGVDLFGGAVRLPVRLFAVHRVRPVMHIGP